MKQGKTINFLDSIPKFNLYSHYGVCLDKIFKKNSLKNLIETLKFHEEYRRQFLSEGRFIMPTETGDNKNLINGNKNDFISIEKLLEHRENKEEPIDIFSVHYNPKSSKNQEITKTKNINTFFHRGNSVKTIEIPDGFRYSPNYKAISKNVPFVKISKPTSFANIKKKINLEKLTKSKNIQKSNILLQYKYDSDKINEKTASKSKNYINKENKLPTLLTELELFENKIYKTITQDKTINENLGKKDQFSNSSKNCKVNKTIGKLETPYSLTKLNLQKYDSSYSITNKKMLKNDIKLKQVNSKDQNLSFYKRNKAIDFSKMQSHSYRSLLNKNSLTSPNAGYYNPKYDLIEQSPRNVFFSKKPIDKLKSKKLKLNQILTSYKIESKYCIVDNNKLNDEILKEYNI